MIAPYLFVLFFVLPFVVVFSVTPRASRRVRMGRMVVAIALGYLLLGSALYFGDTADYTHYERCLAMLEHLPHQPDRHAACAHHVTVADGAGNAFWLLFGWLPATMIVGWWELLWRRRYRQAMHSLRKGMGDDRLSNLVVTLSYYMTLLLAVAVTLVAIGIMVNA